MNFIPRSMLFVSGERAALFDKAAAAGADLICIDLEDAVRPASRERARAEALAWLAARPSGSRVALRVNGLRTLDGLRDLLALTASTVRLDALLLPKTESAADVETLEALVGDRTASIVALLESPRGLERAWEIARAPKLGALMLGGADLSVELGAAFDLAGLAWARGRLVNAARAAGRQAWDVPHVDLADPDGLAAETRAVLALGYDCKTAIHPRQLPTIHAAFRPSDAERAWADALLRALPAGASSGTNDVGAFLFEGRMVDAPLLKKARRIAERAARP